MLLRIWLTFSVVIAIVQGLLAFLSILQHDAIFSDLLRRRVSVIAQTSASAFQPIVDLGLPLSMVRDGDAILERALVMDPEIRAVHAFNPSGIVIYSTEAQPPQAVPPEMLGAMRLAEGPDWSLETAGDIYSGFDVRRGDDTVGAVVVAYPRDRVTAASRAIAADTIRAAALISAAFSAGAWLLLRLVLAGPRRAIARLGEGAPEPGPGLRLFGPEIARLERNLADAGKHFKAVESALGALAGGGATAPPAPSDAPDPAPDPDTSPSRSLAARLASRLAPIAALCVVTSALILGATTLRHVTRSLEPELSGRTNLIGTVVSDNVQRGVEAGVPLDRLVGAEQYFGSVLERLPEVAYIAVATGRIVWEAGERIDPYLAPPRERKDVRSHPILHDGEEIAYVVIDVDPRFITKRFRDVFLDMGVVILVSVLLSFEVMVLLSSRSLTAPLDRLQRLAATQALGDFSMRAAAGARGAIGRMTGLLSQRAETLHRQFAAALGAARSDGARAALDRLGLRFGLTAAGPATLRISYFTDIRLALFLFAAADELPLSFLPLYARAATNTWPWLDESVLISLPLAGYLVAIVVGSPWARALVERFGVRPLFVLAALPNVAAQVGLYFAGTAQEVILWRTVTGFGYALVTLAAQDYVIDVTPREQRDRTLGVFTLVLFGGIFSGVALGGVLADRLGQRNVFLLSAGLIAASALLSARLIAPGVGVSATRTAAPRLREMLGPLRDARFAALVFGIAIPSNVFLQAFVSYLVALTLDGLGASTADIGRTLMLFFLAVVAVGPLAGRLAEAGVPASTNALAGAALASAALLLVAALPSTLTMIVAMIGSGVGHGLVRGAQVSLAMAMAEAELSRFGPATVLGGLRTFERLSSVAGLVMIAAIAGFAGYGVATTTVAVWTLAGAALFALVFLGPWSLSQRLTE